MARKVKLILNPMANMGNAWKVAKDLRPIAAEYGHADWSGTVYPTHAIELARQAGEQGYETVIAVGGFLVAPEAKLDDGILHYATIRKVSRAMMFRLIPEVMKGTHGRFKPVRMGTCRKMSPISDRPIYIHADGEIYTGFGSNVRRLSIEVVPEALRVVRGA